MLKRCRKTRENKDCTILFFSLEIKISTHSQSAYPLNSEKNSYSPNQSIKKGIILQVVTDCTLNFLLNFCLYFDATRPVGK